ncbi:MAG TPA: hypothetical protein QGF02_02060 [Candidatus Babeliales bacterium]|nr:hypothetical protein [Candidatus Babeliales bacterium]
MKKVILIAGILSVSCLFAEELEHRVLGTELVAQVVRSAGPFVDLSEMDSVLISKAYIELDEAMMQQRVSKEFRLLYQMLKASRSKSLELPRLVPVRLVSHCLRTLELLSHKEVRRWNGVSRLIGEIIKEKVLVQDDSLDHLIKRYPLYFSYLVQNTDA